MSSQKAFTTGAAVGSAATGLIAMVIANRRKITAKLGFQPSPVPIRPTPTLGSRDKPQPIPGLSSVAATSEKNARLGSRDKPQSIPGLASTTQASGKKSELTSRDKPQPIPGLTSKRPMPLPLLESLAEKTHLQPAASISISNNDGTHTTTSGYHLLRANGKPIGLSLTPYLDEANTQAGWALTHHQTGRMIDGPMSTKDEAHQLGTRLATLTTWDQKRLPADDMKQAAAIIKRHRAQRLAK
ncbi:MAG: hypothetical protein AAF485_07165 [Chloroflexota bacterium]